MKSGKPMRSKTHDEGGQGGLRLACAAGMQAIGFASSALDRSWMSRRRAGAAA